VTDPAGNWKTFTTDVLGNLVTVTTEPDPLNQPSGTVTTTYAYDWMNHLTMSTMTRGSVTQTRTFVYNNAGQLASATNPENGTVTYTYNTTGTLASKVDANNQTTSYTYDSENRITTVARSRSGTADPCQTVTYAYGSNTSAFNYGRLVSATYGTLSQACVPGGLPTQYVEQYTHNFAGGVASKGLTMNRVVSGQTVGGSGFHGGLNVSHNYDEWGNVASTGYTGSDPFNSSPYSPGYVSFSYTRDTMGRPVSLTEGGPYPHTTVNWVQGVQYDAASRMTQMQYPRYSAVFDYMTEAKAYNVNGQLASLTWTPGVSGQGAPSGTISYTYTGTGHAGDNGQVVSASDGVSGETIAYQYDALKRVSSASSTPNVGNTPAAWRQTFSYDGFGNLTGRTALNGVVSAIPVNAAANQLMNQAGVLSNVVYDANGNLLSENGLTMTYDEGNRVASATVSGGGTEYYGYDPENKRMYKMHADGTEEWALYGAKGEKLGTYQWVLNTDGEGDYWYTTTVLTSNVWFAGKLVWSGTAAGTSGPAFTDRLGTNRASGARFYPYGDEITSTGNDRVKFATYTRSSFTGLDYADQRYYASTYGRFNTVDPMAASADPKTPGTWNRYAYVGGDPANNNDPHGTDQFDLGGFDPTDGFDDGGGYAGLNPCIQIGYGLFGGAFNCGMPVVPYQPPTSPVASAPTCGQVLGLQSSGAVPFSASGLSASDLLGITSFFEDEAAVPLGSSASSTILSIWSAIDWTFENRAGLSPSQAGLFYGAKNVPTTFQGVVTGTSRSQGSQVWTAGSGTLKSNFTTQLNGILSGSANTSLCNGLDDSLAVGVGATSGYLPNPVAGALQFASGGVVPGHGPGVVENPVAVFGSFTFYQPIYPTQ
jgi:RHS repeat-associated protein